MGGWSGIDFSAFDPDEPIEMAALSDAQVAVIQSVCGETAARFEALR